MRSAAAQTSASVETRWLWGTRRPAALMRSFITACPGTPDRVDRHAPGPDLLPDGSRREQQLQQDSTGHAAPANQLTAEAGHRSASSKSRGPGCSRRGVACTRLAGGRQGPLRRRSHAPRPLRDRGQSRASRRGSQGRESRRAWGPPARPLSPANRHAATTVSANFFDTRRAMKTVIFAAPFPMSATMRFCRALCQLSGVRCGRPLPAAAPGHHGPCLGRAGGQCTGHRSCWRPVGGSRRGSGLHRLVGVLENMQEQPAAVRAELGLPGTDPQTARLFGTRPP